MRRLRDRPKHDQLDTLSGEFDGLFARMQTEAAAAGMQAAFDAYPQELGKAAVAYARKLTPANHRWGAADSACGGWG
jgi:hypothetical protein